MESAIGEPIDPTRWYQPAEAEQAIPVGSTTVTLPGLGITLPSDQAAKVRLAFLIEQIQMPTFCTVNGELRFRHGPLDVTYKPGTSTKHKNTDGLQSRLNKMDKAAQGKVGDCSVLMYVEPEITGAGKKDFNDFVSVFTIREHTVILDECLENAPRASPEDLQRARQNAAFRIAEAHNSAAFGILDSRGFNPGPEATARMRDLGVPRDLKQHVQVIHFRNKAVADAVHRAKSVSITGIAGAIRMISVEAHPYGWCKPAMTSALEQFGITLYSSKLSVSRRDLLCLAEAITAAIQDSIPEVQSGADAYCNTNATAAAYRKQHPDNPTPFQALTANGTPLDLANAEPETLLHCLLYQHSGGSRQPNPEMAARSYVQDEPHYPAQEFEILAASRQAAAALGVALSDPDDILRQRDLNGFNFRYNSTRQARTSTSSSTDHGSSHTTGAEGPGNSSTSTAGARRGIRGPHDSNDSDADKERLRLEQQHNAWLDQLSRAPLGHMGYALGLATSGNGRQGLAAAAGWVTAEPAAKEDVNSMMTRVGEAVGDACNTIWFHVATSFPALQPQRNAAAPTIKAAAFSRRTAMAAAAAKAVLPPTQPPPPPLPVAPPANTTTRPPIAATTAALLTVAASPGAASPGGRPRDENEPEQPDAKRVSTGGSTGAKGGP
ncbi:hypothetical protein HYH02_015328 [Chlamydomonas schloesseri]|nr:hypothetical protein HYH02_015328 [Chlamydomonas schloesseri]|eukprot:KAG2423414.1 hypothetical protein HYH02_015328 [Chlamydomonas schloesseri]